MKQWTERDVTARSGIVKLDRVITDMGYFWRPTANSDVGIDGEIELVEDRAATAKIIKAQVKSGPSYFKKEDQRSFEFHASTEDVKYWLAANNPVLIGIYHPERDVLPCHSRSGVQPERTRKFREPVSCFRQFAYSLDVIENPADLQTTEVCCQRQSCLAAERSWPPAFASSLT